MTVSGVYRILNTKNNKCYIGQSLDIERRLDQHYRALNSLSHRHHSEDFQKDWDKYGENAFKAEILELCPESKLEEREKYWIAFYNSGEDGYNVRECYNKPLKDKLESVIQELIELKQNI